MLNGIITLYTAYLAIVSLSANVSLSELDKYNLGLNKGVEMTQEMIEEEEFYDSLENLAICVEAEAGNQGLKGKQLVVDVILNRVDSPMFPNDINSVIEQPGQFSVYSNGSMGKIYEPSEETFEAINMELEHRTNNEVLYFRTGNYHSGMKKLFKHGNHYFSGKYQ